jgi:hypothetical protein
MNSKTLGLQSKKKTGKSGSTAAQQEFIIYFHFHHMLVEFGCLFSPLTLLKPYKLKVALMHLWGSSDNRRQYGKFTNQALPVHLNKYMNFLPHVAQTEIICEVG